MAASKQVCLGSVVQVNGMLGFRVWLSQSRVSERDGGTYGMLGFSVWLSQSRSFDESKSSYKTSLDRSYSNEQSLYSPKHDTTLQLEEAKKEADNVCDFVCTSTTIICSSTFITSAVGLSIIIPVVMIVLGVKYMEDCPLEPKIPIFHIIGGCFWLLKIGITIWRSIQYRHQGSVDDLFDSDGAQRGITSKTYRTMNILLSLFLLIWHILGTVWVLSIWKPRFQALLHRPNQWCDRSIYFFSVAIIVGVYAVLALALLGICCLTCVYKTNSLSGSSKR
ncbi:transmembrane protein 272-like [Physella acuta]|uniref:transmembrane protein 272-like n=1 Tax=Physella acuta TaxID=109671 RepID=UPI0027DE5182|nr:transmembrane protein 272-like [Physella acuta]